MILDSIGVACPPHGLQMGDRKQVAEFFVAGDQRDRWFTDNIFEKTTVEHRPSVLLSSSEGDLRERQSFFQTVNGSGNSLGPTTAERMQAYEEHAGGLALAACQDAFAASQVEPGEITHTVTASCTGFSAPGFDLALVEQLSLPPTVKRTHLGFMGCHAGLNCLRVADAIARAEPQSKVLVCSTELCSLHYQYAGAPDQIVANALFADGAGAAIVHSGEDLSTAVDPWQIAGNGSFILPKSSEMMKWNIEDHGFTMKLSDRIPDMVRRYAGPWLESWLSSFDLTTNQVNGWAVHPGGPQILNSFEISLSLETQALEPSRDLLRNRGNMSSASVFFLLKEMKANPARLPCVAVGFGPGLTIEAALFQ